MVQRGPAQKWSCFIIFEMCLIPEPFYFVSCPIFEEVLNTLLKESESESCSVVSASLRPHGPYSPWNYLGQNTGVGSLSFHQAIFPTQWSNLALLHCRWDSLPAEPPGKPKNTGVGSLSLLQRIFLTQESNWGLLHCRWILYQLSSQGSPFAGYTLHLVPKEVPRASYRTSACLESIGGESQWISLGLGPVYKGRRWERETPVLLCLIGGTLKQTDSTFEFSWDQRVVLMDIYQSSAFLW